jgi:hypothetical protein
MTFQGVQKTANSIVAPALSIHTILPAPPHNTYFNGPTPVEITLGRSSASIQGSVTPAGGAGGGGTVPADLGSQPTTSGTAGSPGSAGTGTSASPASLPSTSGGLAPSLAASAPSRKALGPSARRALTTGRRAGLGSIFDLYLILIAVGVIGIVASQVLSFVGVRSSWKS